ncbi:hypothetical protein OG435_47505 [Streptomyces sp. NBC_01264]|nr:hypothetical protein [Streptomyces sp. NBC_01264]
MTSSQASPQLIGRIARAQWGIEAVHHVRDTTFAEDASKIRTGHGPANMATLRNLAINTLRDTGHHNIAAGLRETSYTPFTRPLDLLGLLIFDYGLDAGGVSSRPVPARNPMRSSGWRWM